MKADMLEGSQELKSEGLTCLIGKLRIQTPLPALAIVQTRQGRLRIRELVSGHTLYISTIHSGLATGKSNRIKNSDDIRSMRIYSNDKQRYYPAYHSSGGGFLSFSKASINLARNSSYN